MSNRIAELRKEHGLTLKQMGDELGIRDNTLSQYETEQRQPKLQTLITIANYFDVSLDYLLKNTDKRDFCIKSDEDAIEILTLISNGKISTDNLTVTTQFKLSEWTQDNIELLKKNHSNLLDLALSLSESTFKFYKVVFKNFIDRWENKELAKLNSNFNDLFLNEVDNDFSVYEKILLTNVMQLIKTTHGTSVSDQILSMIASVLMKITKTSMDVNKMADKEIYEYRDGSSEVIKQIFDIIQNSDLNK